jgi:hypothetical protein
MHERAGDVAPRKTSSEGAWSTKRGGICLLGLKRPASRRKAGQVSRDNEIEQAFGTVPSHCWHPRISVRFGHIGCRASPHRQKAGALRRLDEDYPDSRAVPSSGCGVPYSPGHRYGSENPHSSVEEIAFHPLAWAGVTTRASSSFRAGRWSDFKTVDTRTPTPVLGYRWASGDGIVVWLKPGRPVV